MVKTGQTLAAAFACRAADGTLTTPSVGPAGVLYVDGVVNVATVTITGTNPYKWAVTLPTLTAGACVQVYITATVAGVAQGTFEFTDIADANTLKDIGDYIEFNSLAIGKVAKLGSLGLKSGLTSITYGSGLFAAVGRNTDLTPKEICLTSEDGLIWTRRTVPALPVAGTWTGICRTATNYVAVGSYSDIAATSPTGVTWTSRTLPAVARWNSVAALGALVCATVFNSTALALSSDHGENWAAQTFPVTPSSATNICANANVFCVAVYGSASCWTSANGVAWTERPLGVGAQNWTKALAGTGTNLLLVPQGVAFGRYSEDNGATWETVTLPQTAAWNAACWTGEKWLVIAYDDDAYASSLDGRIWTAGKMPLRSGWYGVASSGDLSVCVSASSAVAGSSTPVNYAALLGVPNSDVNVVSLSDTGQQDIADALDLAPTGSTPATNSLNKLVSSDIIENLDTIEALARFNSIAIGKVAKLGSLGIEANLAAIAYGAGVFVGVGRNSALTPDEICLTSEDGLIWTRRTVPALSSASALYAGICRTSTTFITVGYNSDVAATSPTGVTWTSRTLPSSTRWTSIAALGDLVCATAFNSGALAISSDHGATWTPQTLPVAPTSLSQIVANANVFCVAVYGSASCWTSPDGVVWTERPLGMGSRNWARAIAGTGSNLLLVPQGVAWGRFSTDNGATWETVTLPQVADWNAACWTGTEWIIAAYSSNVCATSPDGLTWEASQLPLSSGWYGIASDGILSVAISNGFAISGVTTATNYVGLLGLPNSNVNVVSVANGAQQDIADALDLAQAVQPRVTNLLLPGELEAAYTANKLAGDSAAADYVAGVFPAFGLQASALHAVADDLYIGICNNPTSSNGAVIMRLDADGVLHFETALNEQGVLSITSNAGKVYIVGLDRTSTGAPYVGNVYVRSVAGVWTKRSTVPQAEHIWCQRFIDGVWYIGTGTQTNGTTPYSADLMASADDGATWTLVYKFNDWISLTAIGVLGTTLYVIGTTATAYDGVRYSTDSGATWTDVSGSSDDTGCYIRPDMPEFRGRLLLLTLGAIIPPYTLPLRSEGVLAIASDNTVVRYPFPADVLAGDTNGYRFRRLWTNEAHDICYVDTASGIYYSRDLIVWTLLVSHTDIEPVASVTYWDNRERFVMSSTGLLAQLDLLRPVGVGDAELPPTLAGSVAAGVATGIAAADYLAKQVPGDYPNGTAGYVLGLIAAGGSEMITPTNPVAEGGVVTLYQGYDYAAIDGLSCDFLKASPPDFTGCTATMLVDGVLYAGSIVNPGSTLQTLRFEFTAAQTAAMKVGTFEYYAQVTKSGRKLLRWTGPFIVKD